MRGHLEHGQQALLERGTIPAGAGTPVRLVGRTGWNRDYPRGCGDTSSMIGCTQSASGLSPRVRGHRGYRPEMEQGFGTIPAGAGTPRRLRPGPELTWDYPRGCGDTSSSTRTRPSPRGLSPRVRGHRIEPARKRNKIGTIPAGAGTPTGHDSSSRSAGDYPRGCGDTTRPRFAPTTATGLSPRVRGHPGLLQHQLNGDGTIPAGAGTPDSAQM